MRKFALPILLLLLLCTAAGCSVFNPTTNPNGTIKKNPVTLTQRTTQYTSIYVDLEKSLSNLYEAGFIPDNTFRVLATPMHAARKALADMRTAARLQDATQWGVYEKGFFGALDGLIAERHAAETKQAATTRPAFAPP